MLKPKLFLVLWSLAGGAASVGEALSVEPSSRGRSSHTRELSRRTLLVEQPGRAIAAALATAGIIGNFNKENSQAWAANTPPTGSKAPDFELPNSRGEGTTSLQSLVKTGKWTVLYFYPGAFTTGCTLEARAFQRDIDQYRNYNAQIVGVSVDPPEKNSQFCSSEGKASLTVLTTVRSCLIY